VRTYLARVGELQSEILLGLTYLVVVGIVWSTLRIAGRRLLDADRPRWHRRSRLVDPAGDLRLPF
jgi:uncharacterized membrane protein YhaH (DUF805 family)